MERQRTYLVRARSTIGCLYNDLGEYPHSFIHLDDIVYSLFIYIYIHLNLCHARGRSGKLKMDQIRLLELMGISMEKKRGNRSCMRYDRDFVS